MTVLHYKRNRLIFSTTFACLALLFVAGLGYSVVAPFFSSADPARLLLAVFWTALLASCCIAIIAIVIAGWTHRIEFSATAIATQARLPVFAQRFSCEYAEVIAVRRAGPGIIEIVGPAKSVLRITPRIFTMDETALFELLAQHIPAERIQPDLRSQYKRQTRREKYFSAALITIELCCLFVVFSSANALFPLPGAWNYFGPWAWLPDRISGFSVESPNSVWIARRGNLAAGTTLEHITGNSTQSWVVPGARLAPSDDRASQILAGAQGQPLLVAVHSAYFPVHGQWEKLAYPAGNSAMNGLQDASVLTAEIWLPLDIPDSGFRNALLHIQADPPQAQLVTLPDPATQEAIDVGKIVITADGTALAEGNNIIYLVQKGIVQKQRYPLAVQDQRVIVDFTLADDGAVYALSLDFSRSEGAVERIGRDGRQTYTQLPVLHPTEDGLSRNYRSIEIDARGRLWVAGSYPRLVGIYKPVWGGTAIEIIEYDEYNSNYQNDLSDQLLRTSDGRIWLASYSHLIWIDSNAADLPAVLPDWLARLRHYDVEFSIVMALGFMILLLSAAFLLTSPRLRRKNTG